MTVGTTYLPLFMNVTGHDTDLAFAGFDDSWTVGSDDASGGLLAESVLHTDHVVLWYTVGDNNNETDLSFYSFHNCLRSVRRRNVDHRCITASNFLRLRAVFEYW